MEDAYLIYSILVSVGLLIYIVYTLSITHVSDWKIRKTIKEHFSDQNCEVVNIKELSITERIRYRDQPLKILRVFNYYYSILTKEINYVRKVEVKDRKDNQVYIKFVDLWFRKNELQTIKTFDTYKF